MSKLKDLFEEYLANLNRYYSEEKSLTKENEQVLNDLLAKIYKMEEDKQKKYFEEEACNIYSILENNFNSLKQELLKTNYKNNRKQKKRVKTFYSISNKILKSLHHFLGEKFFLLYSSSNIDITYKENHIRFEKFQEMVYKSAQQRKKLNAIKNKCVG